MKIEIKDKTGFFDRVRSIARKRPAVAKAILVEFSNEAVKNGKENITREGARGLTPVDKANLVSTLRTITENDKVVFIAGGMVGSGNPSEYVDYALWINNGTSKMPGRFYMESAVNRSLDNFNSFSKKIVESWIDK